MILGSQFFIVGFIAEIFLSNNRNKINTLSKKKFQKMTIEERASMVVKTF